MSNTERKYSNIVAKNKFFVKQLDNLGFNRKYLGFYMLIEIMGILINEGVRVTSFSKQVYPIIANKYGKSCCTVERNIRSLIMKSWSVDLMQKLQKYYPESFKPTCRDFIFMIKNYISNQII